MRIRASGFTITELLVVVAIITVLISLCLPAVNSILGARGLTRATSEIYDLIELARNEAMSTQGYVYLGFANTINANGNDELVGAVLSSPGGKAGVTSNAGQSYLVRLQYATAIFRWENVRLIPFSDLIPGVQALRETTTQSLSLCDRDALDFQIGLNYMTSTPVAYKAFIFSPQGHALFQSKETYGPGYTRFSELTISTPYERWIDIAIKPTRAGADLPNPSDQAALILNGVNGQVQILRP